MDDCYKKGPFGASKKYTISTPSPPKKNNTADWLSSDFRWKNRRRQCRRRSFFANEWDQDIIVVGIEVLARPWHIEGLQLKLSDGTNRMVGNMISGNNADLHKLVEWDQEARIAPMKMWRNKAGNKLGKILFTLSTGNTFDVGNQTTGNAITIAGFHSLHTSRF